MTLWKNFDIELFDHDTVGETETVRVRVARSPAGAQRDAQRVTLPPSLRELAARLAKSDLSLDDAIALGRALAGVLLPGNAAALLETCRGGLAEHEGLRLRIELRALALADLPWEFAWLAPRDADEATPERGFLALDRCLSVVRYEPVAQPVREFASLGGAPLRIAMLLANPRIPGWAELDLAREEASIRAALADEKDVTLSVHPNATDKALNEALDARPHVLHFSGHGRFRMRPGDTFGTYVGEGQLMLEDGDGRPDPVAARELATRMRGANVRLAVLNCCESGRRDALNPFTGVAPTLVREGVPAVIAMQYPIRDAQAERFSRRLYHNLAAHESVDAAVTAARIAMFGVDGRVDRDWGIPVLYLRSEQSVLFPDPDAAPPPGPVRLSRLGLINLALSGVLVFLLAFLYLRHVEPRLPFGRVVGGVLIAALATALTYVSTVAGEALRAPLLALLSRRRAAAALGAAVAACALALALLPDPIALRIVAGKSLLSRLADADLAQPLQTYRLVVQNGDDRAVAADFRAGGVTLAGSESMARRLARRHDEAAAAQMSNYLLTNGLQAQADAFTGRWQKAPGVLGLRGFAKAAGLQVQIERGDAVVACRVVAGKTLTDEMTVIFLEKDDACE